MEFHDHFLKVTTFLTMKQNQKQKRKHPNKELFFTYIKVALYKTHTFSCFYQNFPWVENVFTSMFLTAT